MPHCWKSPVTAHLIFHLRQAIVQYVRSILKKLFTPFNRDDISFFCYFCIDRKDFLLKPDFRAKFLWVIGGTTVIFDQSNVANANC